MERTYDDSYTGNGPYTSEQGYSPIRHFGQWQDSRIAQTNAKIDAARGQPNYGNEGRSVPEPITGGLQAAPAAPAPTQRPDDITGSAARIQAANPRGGQAVPQMARTLVQESQQRFAPQQGGEGSIGVDGYMRQLQNIRALNQMDTPAGPGILGGDGPTWQERQNAEMTSKWAQEDHDRQLRSVLGGSGADARARMGAYTSYANGQTSADTQRQNAMLGYQGGRERDASAERIAGSRDQMQFGLEGMRGKNQLAAESMRGGNQLAAERMRNDTQFGLEGMRRAGRMDEIGAQAENAYGLQEARYGHEAPERTARIRQANSAADVNEQAMLTSKGLPAHMQAADGRFEKLVNAGVKRPEDYNAFMAEETARWNQGRLQYLRDKYEKEKKAAGGVVGYAGGGPVGADGLTDAQRSKLNATRSNLDINTPPAQPQGLPAPQRQQAPAAQQPVGYLENVATGGLERRMKQNGLAAGGMVRQPGETDQGYLARISKEGQDYTAGFGKPTGAGLPAGVPGMVSYEPGGVQRRSIGGIDHITDPNAPGGANYQPAPPSGLDASGGYGTYSGSGQARGVTPWDQTPGGQNGFAFGGAVPPQDVPGGRAVAQAVAGRQVFGQSDGSGTDDALPAVIDGERPAALTSGEFVWPVKAVQFYGMDRLNKMLAAAEKGMAAQGDTA